VYNTGYDNVKSNTVPVTGVAKDLVVVLRNSSGAQHFPITKNKRELIK
jgi:hypothetical protein